MKLAIDAYDTGKWEQNGQFFRTQLVYLHHMVVTKPLWHVLLPTMLTHILNVSYTGKLS